MRANGKTERPEPAARESSPMSVISGLARQGAESFFASQRIHPRPAST